MRLPNKRFCANCPIYDFGTREDCERECEVYKRNEGNCHGFRDKSTADKLCDYCPHGDACYDATTDRVWGGEDEDGDEPRDPVRENLDKYGTPF